MIGFQCRTGTNLISLLAAYLGALCYSFDRVRRRNKCLKALWDRAHGFGRSPLLVCDIDANRCAKKTAVSLLYFLLSSLPLYFVSLRYALSANHVAKCDSWITWTTICKLQVDVIDKYFFSFEIHFYYIFSRENKMKYSKHCWFLKT